MAIAPTGTIYKSLIFDGKDSRAYGVYITGAGVYNAPERAVEMISIPGRNGSFALDGGRFENIEIEYPAGIFADNEADFRTAISNFRNLLCSKIGYCRLTDEYNPGEYRMAVYKSGLEVDPAQLKAGEFTIKFIAKPQRWLTSGETPIALSSGDTVNNPTLFETGPFLDVEGYGTISFNNYNIEINPLQLGPVDLWNETNYPEAYHRDVTKTATFPANLLNAGDTFTIAETKCETTYKSGAGYPVTGTDPVTTISGITGATATGVVEYSQSGGSYYAAYILRVTVPALSFVYGTSKSESCTASISGTVTHSHGSWSVNYSVTTTIAYDGAQTLTFTWNLSQTLPFACTVPAATGNSSIPITDTIIYIDCDLGDAYRIADGVPVSLNTYIDLGSELPTLAPGDNVITFDNTITDLKITTRAWKI